LSFSEKIRSLDLFDLLAVDELSFDEMPELLVHTGKYLITLLVDLRFLLVDCWLVVVNARSAAYCLIIAIAKAPCLLRPVEFNVEP